MSTNLKSAVSSDRTSVLVPSQLSAAAITNDNHRLLQLSKAYQADQQVKYLHLQAEIDVLIQELQTLKHKQLVCQ